MRDLTEALPTPRYDDAPDAASGAKGPVNRGPAEPKRCGARRAGRPGAGR